MKYISALLKAIFSLYGLLVFITVMLLLFPFIIIASFFGKGKGANIIYKLCQLWADIAFVLWGITHKNIFETPHDSSKQYVFLFNHISYMDIPVLMKVFRHQHFRILGKAEIAKVPLFGFIYKYVVVLVDRGSIAKRTASVRQLKAVIKKNISVAIAPEGTFNETQQPLKEFFDGAFRIAIETQTPIKPILFLDTYNRMNYKTVLSLTPGKSRAVYLDEISVEGLTLKDVKALKEKVHSIMEQKLLFYNAAWIKQSPSLQ